MTAVAPRPSAARSIDGTAAAGASIHRLDRVDSTQAVLRELARGGAPEGTAVTARHQTAGRGRLGRRWWDAPGESLLVSVLLRPAVPAAHAPQLSLVAGLAVTDALAAAASVEAELRWPNDVLVAGRKLCGILAEAASSAGPHVDWVIVGIGINLGQLDFPPELRDRATSVRLLTGRVPDREALLGALLAALERRYREWLARGFAASREAWRARSSTIGARLRLVSGASVTAVDVAEDGALLVQAADGSVARVVSGDLTRDGETGGRACSS